MPATSGLMTWNFTPAKSPPRMTRTTSSYLLATPGTRFDRLWRASKWDGWCLNLQQWIQMPMTQTTANKVLTPAELLFLFDVCLGLQ